MHNMTTSPLGSMRIVFNTHRPYSGEGQIIVAESPLPGLWHFNDLTRMISGVAYLTVPPSLRGTAPSIGVDVSKFDQALAATLIMGKYDRGEYEGTRTSEAPQLQPDDSIASIILTRRSTDDPYKTPS